MRSVLLSAIAAALVLILCACAGPAEAQTEARTDTEAPKQTAAETAAPQTKAPETEPETEQQTEQTTETPATEAVTEDPTVRLLTSGAELEYTAKRKFFMSPQTVGGVSYRQLQGGCTDGEFMYFAMNDTKDEDSRSLIYKFEIGAKKPAAVSDPLPTDHSNDMTYDPENRRLVVCHNAPNKKKLSFVDPDTLTVTGTHELPFKAYCIQYVPEKECYVIGVAGTMDIAVTDRDFNELRRIPGEKTGYTKQGVDADENYIYYVQYEKNVVVIDDWEGNRAAIIDLPITGCEPENIFHANGVFYVGCAAGGLALYEITLKEKA